MTKKTHILFSILIFMILISNIAHSYEPTKVDPQLKEYIDNITKTSSPTISTAAITTQVQSTITQEMIPAIIILHNADDSEDIINLINQNNGHIKYIYGLIDAIAFEIPYDNIENFMENRYIKSIYLDTRIQVPAPETILEKQIEILKSKGQYTPMLHKSASTIEAPYVWDQGIDGTGVTIAILDTGIDKTHPALTGKVTKERDFTLKDMILNPSDGFGHGTHIAGIIAGNGAHSTVTADTSSQDTSIFRNIPNPETTSNTGTIELDKTYNILLTDWTFNYIPHKNIYTGDLPKNWTSMTFPNQLHITQPNRNNQLIINTDENHINKISIDNGITWINTSDDTKIETETKRLYLGTADTRTDTLREVKPTIDENDLDILKEQAFTYQDGTTTTMTQKIELTDNTEVRFSEDDPESFKDTPRPILYNPQGTTFYNITLSFPEGLDTRDPDNITDIGPGISEQEITIMNKTYIIGNQEDISTTKIALYTGNLKTLIAGSDLITFDLGGETHTLRMTSWIGSGDTIKGVFLIDGVQHEKGPNSRITLYTMAGTYNIITFQRIQETKIPSPDGGPAIDTAVATILIDSTKMTLEDSEQITKNDETITGAIARFTSDTDMIKKIDITYTPPEDIASEQGTPYTDPIFSSFDFILAGLTPPIKSETRDTITISKNSNNINLNIKNSDETTTSLNILRLEQDGEFRPSVDGSKFHLTDTQDEVTIGDYSILSDGTQSSILKFKYMYTTDNIILFEHVDRNIISIALYTDCTGSETTETDCKATLYLKGAQYNITDIDETDNTIDIDAYSKKQYPGIIPIITKNGARITIVSGMPDQTYSEGIIQVSETDTTELEPENTGTDITLKIRKKTGTNEIDTIDITESSPSTMQSIEDTATYAGLTSYGTYIEDDTEKDNITMWYPDIQTHADVYIKKQGPTQPKDISWGSATIRFRTGIDSYLKILTGYTFMYLDTDGDLDTKTDQMTSFENEHIARYTRYCYSTGCFTDKYYTEYILSHTSQDRQSVTIGLDTDYDNRADIFRGIAPGASLLNAKVIDDRGIGYESDIIAGIEWAVLNNADIISMSLGTYMNICDGKDPISKATETAWDMGTTTVIAAGNTGGWQTKESITAPGCADKVITVGATEKYYENIIPAYFSSIGPTSDGRIKPEIMAPGVQIISLKAKGTNMVPGYTEYYMPASGTSMAAPHIAAAAALLKQADPSLTPDNIKTYLMNGATDIHQTVIRQGAGQVNLKKSYELVKDSKIIISPPILNLIIQNMTEKIIELETTTEDLTLKAFDDNNINKETATSHDTVNSTTGFNHTITITDRTKSANITITWNNKENDIDMRLYDPEDRLYTGSYGITDQENIYMTNPKSGNWRLHAYPFHVLEEEEVTITIETQTPKELDWFTYNKNDSSLTIRPIDRSGLYTGRIQASTNHMNATIPFSIIISEPKEFRSYPTYINFSDDICKNTQTSATTSISTTSSDTETTPIEEPVEETSTAPNIPISNTDKIASFSGYFCESYKRLAYSIPVTDDIPYLDISVWTRDTNPTADIRLFIYNPDGKQYTATDNAGSTEYAHIYDPKKGNWTIVIQSEYMNPTTDTGIIFNSIAKYPGITTSPTHIKRTIKTNTTEDITINITNSMDYDLYLEPGKTYLWLDIPLEVRPDSDSDKADTIPLGYSYRYYNFTIEKDQLQEKTLKSRITSSPTKNHYLEQYIFDSNGTQVATQNTYNEELTWQTTLSDKYEPGTWTAIVATATSSQEETHINLEMWFTEKTAFDWIDITHQPETPFRGTKNISITINPTESITPGYYNAELTINGSLYDTGIISNNTYKGPYHTTIPIAMLITDQMIDITLNTLKDEYKPNEEIIATAALTNNNEQYNPTTGEITWKLTHEQKTQTISNTGNIVIEGKNTIEISQALRPDITEPGTYTLEVYYNYTDHNKVEWSTKNTKTFKIGTANILIIRDKPENISLSGLELQIDVKEDTNASVNILAYTENPTGKTPENHEGTGHYIQIETDSILKNTMIWAILKLNYNESELESKNIDENTLNIYYWNESSTQWELVSGTIDIINNTIYVNITHFSTYGLFGKNNPFCGDNICNNGETCSSCSTDCGQCSSGNSRTSTIRFISEETDETEDNTTSNTQPEKTTSDKDNNIESTITTDSDTGTPGEEKSIRTLKSAALKKNTETPSGFAIKDALERHESTIILAIIMIAILSGLYIRKHTNPHRA